jgi:hypothetical protein
MIGFKQYITEAKLKALDIPLTDSEIKKLAALEKKMEKGVKSRKGSSVVLTGRRALKDTEEELYDNLKARESVPQKDFELKTVAQIAKMSRGQGYAMKAIARHALGRDLQGGLRYLDKSEKLKEEQEPAFLEEYGDKILKMYKSAPYKKLAIQNLESDIEENDYNNRIPKEIVRWALNIITKTKDVSQIVFFDGYKLYQDLEVKEWEEGWTSYQGASMTDKKAEVTFYFDGEEHSEKFDLGTSGYWN